MGGMEEAVFILEMKSFCGPDECEGDNLLINLDGRFSTGNLNGRRFANESMSYKTLGEICLEQPKAVGFQIFDQKIMDQSAKVLAGHPVNKERLRLGKPAATPITSSPG